MGSGAKRRIAFTVQYDGSAYFGWQLQPDQPSVQGELERVLSRLFAAPARVIGSGRTDRGVHAVGQVAAVDAPAGWDATELRRALNALLPPNIWIARATPVADRFHPRFDATGRSYTYRLGLSEVSASPFHAPWCWPLGRPLDATVMISATEAIPGEHSFRAFAKSGQEERGDRCHVTAAGWYEWPGMGWIFRIDADRFLHHMVRYLVGTLVEIGLGRRPPTDMARLLAGDEELETSPPAPPQGLFLSCVTYAAGSYVAFGEGEAPTAGFPVSV
jgi:tRNA pseudouridine38-40 synthase